MKRNCGAYSIMHECEEQKIERMYQELNDTNYPYPMDRTIGQLFEKQVEMNPDAIAVIYGESSLTYRQLNEKAGQAAAALQEQGAKKDSIVGIILDRSLEMIIGIYAILKLGAVYLPISPSYPEKRVEYIVNDSNPVCLIGQNKTISSIEKLGRPYINIEELSFEQYPSISYVNEVKPTDLMYIIYTSGSTGNPKGVMIEHHSVVNRLLWMQRRYPLTNQDTILQKTPFVFDVSIWELYWWSIVGAKVCMLKQGFEKFPQGIIEEIERQKITVLHFVPSMFYVFLNYISNDDYSETLKSLKHVFCSGEALLPKHVMKFNQLLGKKNHTQLTNLYGPTEATVDVTYYDCPIDDNLSSVPIGKPIDNIQMYVLGENGLAALGEKGELCIAGVGVARGYLNRESLTNEKFVYNEICGKRIYKTGDYAYLLPDGNIEYVGRMDNQVKIRGLRIELGEIESKIDEYEAVSQCVVLVKDKETVNPKITAYIETKEEEFSVPALKKYLRTVLPDYMVPNEYKVMQSMPITINGKVDRKALSAI